MTFSPKSVLAWYRARSWWLQILLALIITVPLILACVWWFLSRAIEPSDKDITDILDSVYDDRRQEAEERDQYLAACIKEQADKYQAKVEQREKIMEGNKESHEKINNSSDSGISSAIDDYNEGRRRGD